MGEELQRDEEARPSEKRVKSFKGEYAAKQFVEANAGEKFYVVEEYVDSGEKRGTKPNYNPDYTMVFPRMYSSTASHIKEYKRWSNYKGFNATTSYVSPLVDGAMNRAQFVAHWRGGPLWSAREAGVGAGAATPVFRLRVAF